MKLHRASVDDLENFFGRRDDFIIDAERTGNPALPMFGKIRVSSGFDTIEEARRRRQTGFRCRRLR
jgi:hypothetical protein